MIETVFAEPVFRQLRGLPSPNSGPLLRGARRVYRIDLYGQCRAEGVAFTLPELQSSGNFPLARQSRSHSDRSKYSPKTLKGKR